MISSGRSAFLWAPWIGPIWDHGPIGHGNPMLDHAVQMP